MIIADFPLLLGFIVLNLMSYFVATFSRLGSSLLMPVMAVLVVSAEVLASSVPMVGSPSMYVLAISSTDMLANSSVEYLSIHARIIFSHRNRLQASS